MIRILQKASSFATELKLNPQRIAVFVTKHDTVTGIILTPLVIGFQFPNSSGNACVSWARGAITVIGAIPDDNRG